MSNQIEIENIIKQVWLDVLQVTDVEKDKPFFDVGGNSLLLMKVFLRLDQLYHGIIKIKDLFNYVTIQQLASFIYKHITENVFVKEEN